MRFTAPVPPSGGVSRFPEGDGRRGFSVPLRLLLVLASVLFLSVASVSTLPIPASAESLPGGATRGPSLGGIAEYRFPNGVTALIMPDFSKPTVTVNAVYRVGSAYEADGERGLAHLLEHLLFKGTASHRDITQEIAARGGKANGTTWLDRTNYYEILPASEENLDWALSLEAERMTKASFTPEQLDRERGVVLNEMERGENDPESTLADRMISAAYDWHPYAYSTIGNPKDLKAVSYERMRSFYGRHMRPDAATVVVAGAVDEGRALALVARHFASIPKASGPAPTILTGETGQDGPRSVALSRSGETQAVGLLYHTPAAAAPDFAAGLLLCGVLGDEPSGRLYRNLVEKGLAGSVYAWPAGLKDPSFTLVMAQVPKDKSLDAAQAALIATVEGLGENPPSREELDRARAKIRKEMDLDFASPEGFALGLAEWIARGDWRLFFLTRDRIAQVTPEDLARFARTYLVGENRTLGRFVPRDKPVKVSVVAAGPIPADFAPKTELRLGASFDVTPEALDRATIRPVVPGGMKMAFLPKRTRGGLVTLWIDLHFGSLETLKGRAAAADLAGALLDRGTTNRDRGQVDQAFDRLSASVSLGGDATGARVRLVVPEENLEPALELAAECLKAPAFSEKEFETLRSEALTALAQAKGDPSDRASDLMESHFSPYPPGDLRHHRTLDEQAADLKAASVEQVRAFHRHFYGTSDAEVAAVGQFDPDRLKSLLDRLFGDWRTPVPYERVPEPFIPIAPKDASVSIPDKPNAVLLGAAPLRLRSDDPDYPALLVASTILGGGWLDSRLSVRIRTTEGTSYHVGMGLSVPDLDDGARWSFYAICGPKNLGLVRRAFREELDRALAKGFSADETERARNYLLSARRVERSQDSTLARLLVSHLFLDRTFAWTADLEAKIAVVTPDSAWSALKRHLDPTAFSLVEAGDLEGKDK